MTPCELPVVSLNLFWMDHNVSLKDFTEHWKRRRGEGWWNPRQWAAYLQGGDHLITNRFAARPISITYWQLRKEYRLTQVFGWNVWGVFMRRKDRKGWFCTQNLFSWFWTNSRDDWETQASTNSLCSQSQSDNQWKINLIPEQFSKRSRFTAFSAIFDERAAMRAFCSAVHNSIFYHCIVLIIFSAACRHVQDWLQAATMAWNLISE